VTSGPTRRHDQRPHGEGVVVSSFCSEGGCVGVAIEPGEVIVVDTKSDDAPALRFTPAEWSAFVAGVKAGEFDLLDD
jgi:hypothetical protein